MPLAAYQKIRQGQGNILISEMVAPHMMLMHITYWQQVVGKIY